MSDRVVIGNWWEKQLVLHSAVSSLGLIDARHSVACGEMYIFEFLLAMSCVCIYK